MAMSADTLKSIADARVKAAVGYLGGQLADDRTKALQYYRGEPFGNEIEGRSQIVSRDVAEVVDGTIPSLMKIFTAGDRVVRFDPAEPRDEGIAEQATDYVNWIWNVQNDGFRNFHSWFKDALLYRVGIVKVWWDETETVEKEKYTGLSDAEIQVLGSDPTVEILSSDPSAEAPVDRPLWNVAIKRTIKDGRVRIEPVPSDEFLIERRAVTEDDVGLIGWRGKRTASELIEMGYPKRVIDDVPGDGEERAWSQESTERYRGEDDGVSRGDADLDSSTRKITVTEIWLKVDYDGDGIAEQRRLVLLGDGSTRLVENEEADDHPFAAAIANLEPHKFHGLSQADQTMDIQLVKTTLWRQILDNVYLANNQRTIVKGEVNLDDLLTSRPGGIIRAALGSEVQPIQFASIIGEGFQMIEYADSVREQRTGQTRYNQGLDADTLNKTATGVSIIANAGQQRQEMIARTLAETGVRRAFRRILRLIVKHQQKAKIIRLRGRWVEMDPRSWNAEMDMSVSVGLGTGDKTQQMAHMMSLLGLDEKIIQLQGGADGPILTMKNVYNKLEKLVEAAGLKSAEPYYTDPVSNQQPAQPRPDPLAEKAQAEVMAAQAKAQSDVQIRRMAAEVDMALAQQKAALEADLARQRAALDAELARQKAANDMEIKRLAAGLDIRIREMIAEGAERRREQAGAAAILNEERYRNFASPDASA